MAGQTHGSTGFFENDVVVAKEYEFALKNQQERIKKIIHEKESKDKKHKKKLNEEDSKADRMQENIHKKIKQLEKESLAQP